MDTKEYLQRQKTADWKFTSVVDRDAFLHVNKVHPIKQKEVRDIVAMAKSDRQVKRIIIFGSAIRYDCDIFSDLDICIDWIKPCYDEEGVLKSFTRNMRKNISAITEGQADVVNYDYLNGMEIEDAVKKGVVVYEHNV